MPARLPGQLGSTVWLDAMPRRESPEFDPEGALTPSPAWDEQGLAACSLELAKLLAELGKATFRASGTCMYPGVRPGDLLRIEPKTVREIAVGEIAVFRRAGHLFAHRTIAQGADDHGPFILTRPDRADSGDDGPSYEQDLIGIVSRIERNGRVLPPTRNVLTPSEQAYYSCCLKLIEGKQAVIARLLSWFVAIQQTALYRLAAGFWFARAGRALDFVVQAPLHNQPASTFAQQFTGREIDTFTLDADDHGPTHWTITLRVDRQPAASLALSRCPDECPHAGWWLSGAHTRIRYRGTGVEKHLFRKAAEILARSGVPALRVILPKGAPEERTLAPPRIQREAGPCIRRNAGEIRTQHHPGSGHQVEECP